SARYSGGQNYNGVLSADTSNPLGGSSAFVGASHGYVSTRYDLGALAGNNLRVRFRNSSDYSVNTGLSWLVDEVRIYTCAADTSANTAPAAVGGADQTVAPRDPVTLDGSASNDGDGFILSSSWTQLSGTAVAATNVGRSLTFTAPSTPTQDDLVFRLTVTDNRGATSTDDVTVTVVNPQPQAAAGSDQASTPRTLVSLHGAATDANGTIAAYRWAQTGGPAALVGKAFTTPVLVSNTQAVSVGTGPIDVGTTIMQLDFLPNVLTTAGGTVALGANGFYTVCTSVSGGSCGWVTGTQLGISGSVTSPASTGGAMTWTLQDVHLSDGTAVQGSFKFDIATSTLSSITIIAIGDSSKDVSFFAPSVPTTASLTFRLSVTDNDGGTGSDDLAVQVTNAQPTSNAGADQSLHPRVSAALNGSGTDPDGSVVGYAWTQTAGPAVTITNATSASASIVTPSVATSATLTFQLTTTDNDGGTATDTMDVAVNNSPPTVAAGTDITVNAGASVSLVATASDSDGSIASYNWTQSAGNPVTLTGNTTSTARFTAPSASTQSTYSFQVSVTDSDGAAATDTVTVTVRAATSKSSSGGGGGGGGGALDRVSAGALLGLVAATWMRRRKRNSRSVVS
ncbi:MAG TPA: PKD domain-containing protein, partial [Actinoplanes sp.]|nr:PKD domain-containing protein [Actinoplanes sp.]